jgi:integrase/recombinase XerD
MTLAYAGSPGADRVDLAAGVMVFENLKKRWTGMFRSVPPALLDTSTWCTAFASCMQGAAALAVVADERAVHAVMQAAGLEGVPASPKGLRHGFGVAAVWG